MPDSITPNAESTSCAYPERPSLDMCTAALTKYATRGPFVLYDWRSQWEGLEAAKVMVDEIKQLGRAAMMMKTDADYFEALHIYVPPDVEQAFRAGLPITVEVIANDERKKGNRHRPNDTVAVKVAKVALEVNAFRLLASQTKLEHWENPEQHHQSHTSAGAAASTTLAGAKSHHGKAMVDKKLKVFDGWIDRGRRKVRDFFNAKEPGDVARAATIETQEKLDTGMSGEAISQHNVAQIRAFEKHAGRAVARETAMYRWSTSDDDTPVAEADGRDIANAHLERQSAIDLMQVAIAGGLNPSQIQGHLLTMRQAFDTGCKIGRVLRGNPITVTIEDANEIEKAIATVRRGPPETHEDGCYHYLADALAKCEETLGLSKVAARVRSSRMTEIITPSRNPS
ncbi:hypothetical protein [Devosia sp.]|uniref:hypothetical protein n=1 Tax=Devosia sp. TaxID=1871048 RepID=UPI001B216084|nr:hypothetical protein [Devosia sp.]MBO9591154.1 hypothetical protein [Devosia sp.]